MVRVITVHHFTNQTVQTVEQPTACGVAYPQRLLLALTSNCVEVRDLSNNELQFTFPTVDEVVQIIHCRNGNFVATLETKFNRQNKEINFVRVYVNWDNIATLQQSKMTNSGYSLSNTECGMVQPMRARIAGRVTPTTNQSELSNLEMIEIPVKKNPNLIECCQMSGNLLISSQTFLNIYKFHVKTHDISKLKFIDFEEMPFLIELKFNPNLIKICENYIACMNNNNMYLFKLNETSEVRKEENCNYLLNSEVTIDYQQLMNEETLNLGKSQLTINLPTIIRENSVVHKNSPFTFCEKDMSAKIYMEKSQNISVKNLIQLKLVPIIVENVHRQITEEFKCMELKPIYIDENLNKNYCKSMDKKLISSDFNCCLNGIVCMVATQQDGYLYYFDESESTTNGDNCIAVYPFTAPITKLVMEDYFLHALTEIGLETYTLRYGHQLFRNIDKIDNFNVACPSIHDSVCLVGLRPFLGIEEILLNDNYLILLGNFDGSPTHSVNSNSSSNTAYWTLHNLELPNAKSIFNDISIVANVHRFTSAQTYCHLLSEAHVILRLCLLLKKWTKTNDDNIQLLLAQKFNNDDIIDTYRLSCALLADHYVMCNNKTDYSLAIPYYKMARISPFDVLRRVEKIQEQSKNYATKGLIYHLKTTLLDSKIKLFAANRENFIEKILELLKKQNYKDLPNLILNCHILKEYSTEKLIKILTEINSEDETLLALAILYLQKNNVEKCDFFLGKIKDLMTIILANWQLLFDNYQNKQTLSDLAITLIDNNPDLFADVLFNLIKKEQLNLNRLIKIFIDFLPLNLRNNNASKTLQKTIEQYLFEYFSKNPTNPEKGLNDAMRLLIRSYLSQLKILQMKQEVNVKRMEENPEKDEEDKFFSDTKQEKTLFLFGNFRWEYLNKMPPFQIEITTKLYETCTENYEPIYEHFYGFDSESDLILKKLQAILCYPLINKQIMSEVNIFLDLNSNLRGNLSLKSILLDTNDASLLLLDNCPQCLLQFGKDRFTSTDQWKFLIGNVQKRILKLYENEDLKRIGFFHKKILKDILTHVATAFPLEELLLIFPPKIANNSEIVENNAEIDVLNDIQNYEPFVAMCKDTMQANQINKLITTTSEQLLQTLNL